MYMYLRFSENILKEVTLAFCQYRLIISTLFLQFYHMICMEILHYCKNYFLQVSCGYLCLFVSIYVLQLIKSDFMYDHGLRIARSLILCITNSYPNLKKKYFQISQKFSFSCRNNGWLLENHGLGTCVESSTGNTPNSHNLFGPSAQIGQLFGVHIFK